MEEILDNRFENKEDMQEGKYLTFALRKETYPNCHASNHTEEIALLRISEK